MTVRRACALLLIGLAAGCGGNPAEPDEDLTLTYNGTTASSQWVISTVGTSSTGNRTCTYTYDVRALVVVIIGEPMAESIAADVNINLVPTFVGRTDSSPRTEPGQMSACGSEAAFPTGWNFSIRGPRSSLAGNITNGATSLSFTGRLDGTRLLGTVRVSVSDQSTQNVSGIINNSSTSGSVEIPVSLDPQGR